MSFVGKGIDGSILGNGSFGDVNCNRIVHAATDQGSLPAYTTSGGPGVGYTLTASANGALTVDTYSTSNGDRILVMSTFGHADAGIYTVVDKGTPSTPWILVRATDFNNPLTNNILVGDSVFARFGDAYIHRVIRLTVPGFTVTAASTANVSLSGPVTIDSIVAHDGMSFLLKNQTVASENGVYIFHRNGLQRHPAFVRKSAYANYPHIMVRAGATNAGKYFRTDDVAGYLPDVDDMVFVQVPGALTFGLSKLSWFPFSVNQDTFVEKFTIDIPNDGIGDNGDIYVPFTGGRLYVRSSLTVNVTSPGLWIHFINNGNNGTNASGSVGTGGGSTIGFPLGIGSSGSDGSTDANGIAVTNDFYKDNGDFIALGGAGGAGGEGVGSVAGTTRIGASGQATNKSSYDSIELAQNLVLSRVSNLGASSTSNLWFNGGGGGAGGAGKTASDFGGGGGGGGGVVFMAVREVNAVLESSCYLFLEAMGGNGGVGDGTAAGGGGAGGGGLGILVHGGLNISGGGNIAINVDGGLRGIGFTDLGRSPCRAATTAGLPAYIQSGAGPGANLSATANGRLVVDGVPMSNGDRLFVKNETNSQFNGIYDVTYQGSPSATWSLTRATDFDTVAASGVFKHAYALIDEGVVNKRTRWELTTSGSITVDTTPLTFAQAQGADGGWGAGGTVYLVDMQNGTVTSYPGRSGFGDFFV
jgi:hypothetical protein